MNNWFEVHKDGLGKLLERKGKQFIVYELLQNAWDEKTRKVSVQIARIGNSPFVTLTVVDDNPEGFLDLTHAFTLFAESNKKGDAEKRGRFNLGEKLVLALCRKAVIRSTKGAVYFDEKGRRSSKSNLRDTGTEFVGEIRMTDEEIADVREALALLIPPDDIETTFCLLDGGWRTIQSLKPTAEFTAPLATEIADAEGNMRKTTRKTKVTVYHAAEQAYLYEMGIPVVELDGRFHVNVHQKVPLNFDRDNVTPAYAAKLYALMLDATRNLLTAADVNQVWIKTAIQEQPDLISDETAKAVMDLRFGEKRVAFDPSDLEANNIATAKGYKIVHGGAMSSGEWDLMRRAGAIAAAGQVTPSPKPYGDGDGPPVKVIDPEKWTDGMRRTAALAQCIAQEALGFSISTRIVHTTNDFAACYGGRRMDFNLLRLGHAFFNGALLPIIDLIIHELGHEYESNHLSSKFYDALTRIGAQTTVFFGLNPGRLDHFADIDNFTAKQREAA